MNNKNNQLDNKIYNIRGKQVMLDRDLAETYETEVKSINQAVKRNPKKFPPHFYFQLTQEEMDSAGIKPTDRSHFLPHVFTEYGALALAGVLKSDAAIETGVKIIEAFISMRNYIQENQIKLADKQVQKLLEDKNSIININIHQGGQLTVHNNGNTLIGEGSQVQTVNAADMVLELLKLKLEVKDHSLDEKINKIMAHVAKGEKDEAMKTVKSITDVAKAGSSVFKFASQIAGILGPWLT